MPLIYRYFACLGIVLICIVMIPKRSVGDVYLRSLHDNIGDANDFPHEILGGGVMEISINEQRAHSLILRTSLPPFDAVLQLYNNQENDPESSKYILGVVGGDDWAMYMDLFPGRLYKKEDGSVVASLISNVNQPALVVAAHKDHSGKNTIVNLLTFDGEADLRRAFLDTDNFALGFHSGDSNRAQFSFKTRSGETAQSASQEAIATAHESGMALEFRDDDEDLIALTFTGETQTRDVFITRNSEGNVGIITQDRNTR